MLTYLYVHPKRDASKPTRNGHGHPMEFLIATALTCADVSEMVDRVNVNNSVNAQTKQEIVEIYQIDLTEAVGLECTWDAKVD